jgi:predicted metalloprotease with PDZ domain
MNRSRLITTSLLLASLAVPAAKSQSITVALDATEAPRRLFHSHLEIPATPGAMTLLYAKWIPGEHGPTGPIQSIVGMRITANGAPVTWDRDAVDMYSFNITVPQRATAITVDLDFAASAAQFTAGRSADPNLAVISWNAVLLYPKGRPAEEIMLSPTLRMPEGWRFATPLPVEQASGSQVRFKPVSLASLVDAPIQIGSHLRVVPLMTADGLPHEIDLLSDSDSATITPADFIPKYNNLVTQAGLLFGARHYRDYHWLLTLSDNVEHFGLEHHEASDDRTYESALGKPEDRNRVAGLLAHEYIHSWNGKYRRPQALLSPDYDQPMQGALLWVYEGLTQYLSYILPPRSDLWTPEYFREKLAMTAATLEHQYGRRWRPLGDTTVAAQIGYGAPREWWSMRRGVDFYDESVYIWLEADVTIRELTAGKRSLDDFCRRFYGGPSGMPALRPYTFDDVVAALNDTAAYDWRSFLNKRISGLDIHAPLGGVARSGWTVVYNDTPNTITPSGPEDERTSDYTLTAGMTLRKDGTVSDITPEAPAAAAGLAPGMKVIAVNGRRFTTDLLDTAIREAKGGSAPIALLVENTDFFKTYNVSYSGGLRYAHLERDPSKPDVLSDIIRPRTR